MKHLQVLYLHGFSSSPASSKAVFFRARLEEKGIPVRIPDLNEGDFEHLTIGRMLSCVAREARQFDPARPLVVMGSSLGGYTAALHAALGGRADGLVLLAPAFDVRARWVKNVGGEGIEEWRRAGVRMFEHSSYGDPVPLRFEFYEEADRYEAFPDPGARPVTILHGRQDDVVPVTAARDFVARYPHAALHEFDTDHEMGGALSSMWPHVERFLEGLG